MKKIENQIKKYMLCKKTSITSFKSHFSTNSQDFTELAQAIINDNDLIVVNSKKVNQKIKNIKLHICIDNPITRNKLTLPDLLSQISKIYTENNIQPVDINTKFKFVISVWGLDNSKNNNISLKEFKDIEASFQLFQTACNNFKDVFNYSANPCQGDVVYCKHKNKTILRYSKLALPHIKKLHNIMSTLLQKQSLNEEYNVGLQLFSFTKKNYKGLIQESIKKIFENVQSQIIIKQFVLKKNSEISPDVIFVNFSRENFNALKQEKNN